MYLVRANIGGIDTRRGTFWLHDGLYNHYEKLNLYYLSYWSGTACSGIILNVDGGVSVALACCFFAVMLCIYITVEQCFLLLIFITCPNTDRG